MCGSGTFIIEAISKASGLPANFHPERERKFSCDNFLKTSPFGKIDTKNLKNEAANSWLNACKLNSLPIIIGRDIDENSINIAKKNSSYALPKHLSEFINWEIGPISSATPSVVKNENKGILVVNPPYGKRMQSNVEIEEKQINIQLGEMLKKRFLNWNAWVLSGRPNFISEIRLKPKNKIKVLNGDLKCNWFEFEIFLGSRFR